MRVLKKLLLRQQEKQSELDAKRLDDHWQNHQKAKKEKMKKIQHDFVLSKSENQGESSTRQFSNKTLLSVEESCSLN